MKSAGKARNNGLYRHIRTSKEIIRNLLNDFNKYKKWRQIIWENEDGEECMGWIQNYRLTEFKVPRNK